MAGGAVGAMDDEAAMVGSRVRVLGCQGHIGPAGLEGGPSDDGRLKDRVRQYKSVIVQATEDSWWAGPRVTDEVADWNQDMGEKEQQSWMGAVRSPVGLAAVKTSRSGACSWGRRLWKKEERRGETVRRENKPCIGRDTGQYYATIRNHNLFN